MISLLGWVLGWHRKRATPDPQALYERAAGDARDRQAARDRAAVERLIDEITPKRAQNGGAL